MSSDFGNRPKHESPWVAGRHILHVTQDNTTREWMAWCCCGWKSDYWRLQESARTAAEVHMAGINSGCKECDEGGHG